MNLIPDTINFIDKNSVIYQAGEKASTIGLLMQGNIIQAASDSTVEISPGHFIGIQGLLDGTHCTSYTAKSDSTLRIFEVNSIKDFVQLFINNPELHEDMAGELSILIMQTADLYDTLYTQALNLYQSIFTIKKHYAKQCEQLNYSEISLPLGREVDDFKLSSQDFFSDLKSVQETVEDPAKIYAYMGTDKTKFLTLQLGIIIQLYKIYLRLKSYTQRLFAVLINKDGGSMFTIVSQLAMHADSVDIDKTYTSRLLDTTHNLIITIEKKLKSLVDISITVDYDYIRDCLSKVSGSFELPNDHPLNYPKDTLKHLMDYAGFDDEKKNEFVGLINKFIVLEDKLSRDDKVRILCKQISAVYYELYEAVFFTSVKDSSSYKIVDLFLNFGFLDERLLSSKQVELLLSLKEPEEKSSLNIYRMKEWLTLIYEGKESPSKNDFDEDYFDFVRKKKKQENLSKTEENSYLNNVELKVQYEIHNMFIYNNRLISGNIASFVPMLYKDAFEYNNKLLDSNVLESNLASITAIDYSVFYRELLYADESHKITKELIQKEIYPVMILFPVCGINGIMWQETTRRKADSPGRFFLPSFANVDIKDMLLKVLGRFRWELCKNLQGYSWNDIRVHCLTSEYLDYVQFYRNNKDLSKEKRDQLKSQITSNRNNTREVFVQDYVTWIKYESACALRLNNVARRILSTYCPFSKSIREQLNNQPLFKKAMFKYYLDKSKKIKELHNRYTSLSNKGGTLTPELLETQRFYNDL